MESAARTQLEETFTRIRRFLDQMDELREKILPLQREIVRSASEIIKHIHRTEWDKIPANITTTTVKLQELSSLITQAPDAFEKDYLQIAEQEFGEAQILYYLLKEGEFPTPEQCHISLLNYTYALSDVVGEVRRYILNCLRQEQLTPALQGLEYMDEIYNQLFLLDYPAGLIPGLRNKIDNARGILSKTEGDITVSVNILKLNATLKSK